MSVPDCPRCLKLTDALQCGACDEAKADVDTLVVRKDVVDFHGVSYGGFRLSTKHVALLTLLRALPADEKVIIFSFFKAFLDLTEAALELNGISCFRFDGVHTQREREIAPHAPPPAHHEGVLTTHAPVASRPRV